VLEQADWEIKNKISGQAEFVAERWIAKGLFDMKILNSFHREVSKKILKEEI
jgi:hypothetical protein